MCFEKASADKYQRYVVVCNAYISGENTPLGQEVDYSIRFLNVLQHR